MIKTYATGSHYGEANLSYEPRVRSSASCLSVPWESWVGSWGWQRGMGEGPPHLPFSSQPTLKQNSPVLWQIIY